MPMVLTETASDGSMLSFVQSIFGAVSDKITLTTVAAVIAAIIGAGIVSIFAWKFARKGYNYVKKALEGKNGNV